MNFSSAAFAAAANCPTIAILKFYYFFVIKIAAAAIAAAARFCPKHC